ncbi:tetratricopeptide repeat protein [Azospirillum halopraeferens]|uniref:tetratricopeptide repeat-containing glycosyltransferase family protein n=1 Tax=Azospirillum halopraeferens TaxID=34010 RepID=UPI0003FD3EBA|nr:tetratricopeptide repeat-containing glycosyltransferase family protein [Azospirillum halopraeferens]
MQSSNSEAPAAIVLRADHLVRNRRVAEAIRMLETAAASHPGDAGILVRLAEADLKAGQPRRARARVESLLATGRPLPGRVHALCVRAGAAMKDMGWYRERLDAALREAPGSAEVQLLAGLDRLDRRQPAAALRHLEAAVNLRPGHVSAALALARCLEALADDARAERVLRAALELEPENNNLLINLANALQRLERYDESLETYRRCAAIAGPTASLLANVGALLRRKGAFDEARRVYLAALAQDPGNASVLYNFSNLLKETGDLDGAIRMVRRATAVDPGNAQLHWNLSLALLARGDFREGFAEYEWRWKYAGFPSRRRDFTQPLWDGSSLDGRTLLIHTEQGMGDVLQFLRYLPEIRGRGGRIVLECHDALMTLLAGRPEIDVMIPRFATPPAFDVHLPLLSAPYVLGHATLDDLPADVPYLALPAGTAPFAIPEARPDRLKVGIVWGGNPQFSNDRARSARLSHFLPLLGVEGVQLFSLQKGPREADLAGAPSDIVRLSDRIGDFRDTASAMLQLDLVISTCTSTAHLAGALARPLWVVLHHAPDWRWMVGRDDSPWYPTARLFRQDRPGDWAGVIDRVATALRTMAAAPRG